MYLYTPEAMAYLGGISVAQMVSYILAGLALANEALENSGVNAKFSLVYIGMVRSLERSRRDVIPQDKLRC